MRTIEFTDEELACLDAAFEVLTTGAMAYRVLRMQEIIKVHKDLYRKFRKAYEETKCHLQRPPA